VAARKGSAKVDEVDEVTEDLESEDFEDASMDEDLEETSLDEAFADEEDDLDAEPGLDDDPTELTAEPVDDSEDEGQPTEAATAPEAAFDDEDDDEGIVAAVAGDEDDQEIEGLRDGEFVCRSCYMAKRDTQLADPERLLCRDCA
jgi:hypothetical protein